jgi:hypothetical protein
MTRNEVLARLVQAAAAVTIVIAEVLLFHFASLYTTLA